MHPIGGRATSGSKPSGAAPAAPTVSSAAAPTTANGQAPSGAGAGQRPRPGARRRPARAPLSPPVAVKFGDLPATSNAGIYIALDRGYFREEGLDVTMEVFDSFERAIPPLATNQLDVAGGGVNAGMFSAIGRGLPLKIVAGISGNGAYSSSALVVRKELLDSGRVKDYPDLKGLRIALLSKSSGLGAEYARILQKGGFTEDDIDLKLLPFPDATIAMGNGAIDAAILTEPFVAQLVRTGVGVRWKGADEIYPGHQITALLYGPGLRGAAGAGDALPGGLRARRAGIQCAHQQQRPHAAVRDPGRAHADQGPQHLSVHVAVQHRPRREAERG